MKHEVRKYKMTDAKLVLLAENLKQAAVRDLNYLEENGVSTDTLNELQRAIYNFSYLPTDEELSSVILALTPNQNMDKVAVLQPWRQSARQTPLKQQNVFELVKNERSQREKFHPLEELSTDGITQEMLDKLGSDKKVSTLREKQIKAIKSRDLAVDDRIASGNALYAMMITLAAKGKEYWMELSEKRYNDYISTENYINNWQCTDGHIDPHLAINISITSVTDATVFTLTNNGSSPLIFFFTDNPAATSARHQITLAAGNSHTYTATALGFNEKKGRIRLNVFNGNALPGCYLVEWV